jgi:DNA-directed RNA polymerase subunit RPC12/RpoP
MVECPRCGKETKYLEKAWRYDIYDAKSYYCVECGQTFIAYYKDGELNHTLPRRH